jgi:hypothetical protein
LSRTSLRFIITRSFDFFKTHFFEYYLWRGGTGGTQEYRARLQTAGYLGFFPIEAGNPGFVGDVLALTQTGEVGVRITNPQYTFQVNGDAAIGVDNAPNTGVLPGYGNFLHFLGGPAGPTFPTNNSDPMWIARFNIDSDFSELRINIGDNGLATAQADKLSVGRTDGAGFTSVMNVLSWGAVGVNTTAPVAALDVVGGIKQMGINNVNGQGTYLNWNFNDVTLATGDPINQGMTHFINQRGTGPGGFQFNLFDNGNNFLSSPMTIRPNGRVGIGTVNSALMLHVVGPVVNATGNGRSFTFNGGLNNINASPSTVAFFQGDVLSSLGFYALQNPNLSDARIKNVIGLSNNSQDL